MKNSFVQHSVRTAFALTVAAAAIAMGGPSAMAQPLPAPSPEVAPPGPESDGQFCAILVDKPADPNVPSNELFSTCSDTSIADAEGQLRSSETTTELAQRGVSVQAAIPIMRWSENLNNSSPYTVIYGNAGPCDATGYLLSPSPYWRDRISSMQGYPGNYCYAAWMRNGANAQQDRVLPLGYVGDPWNDNVVQTRVHS